MHYRISDRRPPRRPGSRLSPRQLQTLEQLLAGHSEKEAAAALGLSVHTVHVHVKAIHAHFGVQSRSELLVRFVPVVTGTILLDLIEAGRLHAERATVGVVEPRRGGSYCLTTFPQELDPSTRPDLPRPICVR